VFSKVHPVDAQLKMSHYRLLFSLKNDQEIDYYINQSIDRNLGKREVANIIKSNEYHRLPAETKIKVLIKDKADIKDFVKNPIIIKNSNYQIISEKILQKLILEDICYFLKELGEGFSFIANKYKIKLGDTYNYLDLLLYNIKFKCYVVVELKKEHIDQIQLYMNYIDKNIKTIYEENTIGIIIVKKNNQFIMEYCSDERIISREYELN